MSLNETVFIVWIPHVVHMRDVSKESTDMRKQDEASARLAMTTWEDREVLQQWQGLQANLEIMDPEMKEALDALLLTKGIIFGLPIRHQGFTLVCGFISLLVSWQAIVDSSQLTSVTIQYLFPWPSIVDCPYG